MSERSERKSQQEIYKSIGFGREILRENPNLNDPEFWEEWDKGLQTGKHRQDLIRRGIIQEGE